MEKYKLVRFSAVTNNPCRSCYNCFTVLMNIQGGIVCGNDRNEKETIENGIKERTKDGKH